MRNITVPSCMFTITYCDITSNKFTRGYATVFIPTSESRHKRSFEIQACPLPFRWSERRIAAGISVQCNKPKPNASFNARINVRPMCEVAENNPFSYFSVTHKTLFRWTVTWNVLKIFYLRNNVRSPRIENVCSDLYLSYHFSYFYCFLGYMKHELLQMWPWIVKI